MLPLTRFLQILFTQPSFQFQFDEKQKTLLHFYLNPSIANDTIYADVLRLLRIQSSEG